MANENMASENIVKLIDAISKDEEQLAALEQEVEAPVEKGPGQARAINFEDTIRSLANKYGISVNDKDISDMKGMLGNFNNLSQSGALTLNNGSGSAGGEDDSVKGLFSSLFGGGNNSLFGNTSGSLYGGNNQNVTLTQNQLQQLLSNAGNNSALTNSSALGGLSSLLGGTGSASLLGSGASMLSKLFLVYLFMKLLRGGASLIF